MLITIAKHKRLTEEALDTEICRNKALTKRIAGLEADIQHERQECHSLEVRLAQSIKLNAKKSGTIEAMYPLYKLGLKRRANMDADNARKRARRAANA